jgi:hypothetical protein
MNNWQFTNGTSAVPATHIIITYFIVILTNRYNEAQIVNLSGLLCNAYCQFN